MSTKRIKLETFVELVEPKLKELASKAFGFQSTERGSTESISTGSDEVEILSCLHEPSGPGNESDYDSDVEDEESDDEKIVRYYTTRNHFTSSVTLAI